RRERGGLRPVLREARGDVSRGRPVPAKDRRTGRARLRVAAAGGPLPSRAAAADPRGGILRRRRRPGGRRPACDRPLHRGHRDGDPARPGGLALEARPVENEAAEAAGARTRTRGRMKRLVIAPNWIGDAVMSLPVLRALRRSRPGDRLAVLARSGPGAVY